MVSISVKTNPIDEPYFNLAENEEYALTQFYLSTGRFPSRKRKFQEEEAEGIEGFAYAYSSYVQGNLQVGTTAKADNGDRGFTFVRISDGGGTLAFESDECSMTMTGSGTDEALALIRLLRTAADTIELQMQCNGKERVEQYVANRAT